MNLLKIFAFLLFSFVASTASTETAQPAPVWQFVDEPAASLTVLSSSSARLDYSGFSGSGAYTISWWPHDAPDSKSYAYPTAQTYTVTGLSSGYWDFKVERSVDYIIIEAASL